MRYWVYLNGDVLPELYETQDLYAIAGFTDETLIMPEGSPQQEWTPASNFADVQQARDTQPPARQEGGDTEVYEETTDRNAIPTHYQDIQSGAAGKKKDLETTLLIKMDELTKEIRRLKEEVSTLKAAAAAAAPAGVAPLAEAAPEPEQPLLQPAPEHEYMPEPVFPKPVHTEEVGDLDAISGHAAPSDIFLQQVVEADPSGRGAVVHPEPEQQAEIVDLKSASQPRLAPLPEPESQPEPLLQPEQAAPAPQAEPAQQASQAPRPELAEDVKETPLPYQEELQAEELQAGRYAGEPPLYAQPEEEPKPAPLAAEPEAPVVAAAPNETEDLILREFAQEKVSAEGADSETRQNTAPYIIENTPEEKPAQPQEGAPLQSAQTLEDDKFIKTFTTGIEEVFMDQPTSIISDYVPPALAATSPLAPPPQEAAQQQEQQPRDPLENLMDLTHKTGAGRAQNTQQTVQSVRRIKPAAIKTVPMVTADGQDIQNMDYGLDSQVEEVTIESEGSPVLKFVKMFFGLIFLFVILLMFVALLAWMAVIPREWSPLHSVINKFDGGKAAVVEEQAPPSAPAAAQQAAEDTARQQVLYNVKNYLLLDGMTLEEKVNAMHPASAGQLQWTADRSVEPDYYSVAVMLPPNMQGYTLTYRFSYNLQTRSLTPTTSEANTLMNQRLGTAPLP